LPVAFEVGFGVLGVVGASGASCCLCDCYKNDVQEVGVNWCRLVSGGRLSTGHQAWLFRRRASKPALCL
jgi:hypothetical protein